MSLLKRVGSLKRSTNTYVVPRRAEPDNAERPKGMIRCHTTLLDDAVFTCDIDVSLLSTVGVDFCESNILLYYFSYNIIMRWFVTIFLM